MAARSISGFLSVEQPERPGDDSCTSDSHAVSVPGAGNQNYAPRRRLGFHQGHARASGISEVCVYVMGTFLICLGAIRVLGVVGLLSCFVGGGWRESLGLPRHGSTCSTVRQHCSCCQWHQGAIGVAALRSAMFWSIDHPLWRLGGRATTAVRLDASCVTTAAGKPQRESINLLFIMAATTC